MVPDIYLYLNLFTRYAGMDRYGHLGPQGARDHRWPLLKSMTIHSSENHMTI